MIYQAEYILSGLQLVVLIALSALLNNNIFQKLHKELSMQLFNFH
jgi:hypothetical protein